MNRDISDEHYRHEVETRQARERLEQERRRIEQDRLAERERLAEQHRRDTAPPRV